MYKFYSGVARYNKLIMLKAIMGVAIRGSADRHFDNNNYRKKDEQALTPRNEHDYFNMFEATQIPHIPHLAKITQIYIMILELIIPE